MKVVGVAAPVRCDDTLHSVNPSYEDRLPEYFRLYEADSSGYTLIGQTQWEDSLRYRMCLRHSGGTDTFDVREGYFKDTIIVMDSFYVGGTTINSLQWMNPEGGSSYYHEFAPTNYLFFQPDLNILFEPDNFWADDSPLISKYISPLVFSNMPSTDALDTSVWYRQTSRIPYMAIFPIFAPDEPTDSCSAPSDLQLLNRDSTGVTLSWNVIDSARWQLSYGPEGCLADSGTMVICTDNFITLQDLDTGCYVAYVRTLCNDSLASSWSDGITFCVEPDTSGSGPDNPIAVSLAADRYTVLMPNPAHGQVSLLSSFKIDRIQIFTTTGRRVCQQEVNGIGTSINLTGYPQGVYIVRIDIGNTRLIRKLVVR